VLCLFCMSGVLLMACLVLVWLLDRAYLVLVLEWDVFGLAEIPGGVFGCYSFAWSSRFLCWAALIHVLSRAGGFWQPSLCLGRCRLLQLRLFFHAGRRCDCRGVWASGGFDSPFMPGSLPAGCAHASPPGPDLGLGVSGCTAPAQCSSSGCPLNFAPLPYPDKFSPSSGVSESRHHCVATSVLPVPGLHFSPSLTVGSTLFLDGFRAPRANLPFSAPHPLRTSGRTARPSVAYLGFRLSLPTAWPGFQVAHLVQSLPPFSGCGPHCPALGRGLTRLLVCISSARDVWARRSLHLRLSGALAIGRSERKVARARQYLRWFGARLEGPLGVVQLIFLCWLSVRRPSTSSRTVLWRFQAASLRSAARLHTWTRLLNLAVTAAVWAAGARAAGTPWRARGPLP